MKEATKIMLDLELRSGKYSNTLILDFKDLFEKYLMTEFDDKDNFYKQFCVDSFRDTEFYQFVSCYKDYFNIPNVANFWAEDEKQEDLLDIALRQQIQKAQVYEYNINSAKKFAKIANSATSGGMLLDVGSHYRVPLSSFEFASIVGKPIFSMDNFDSCWKNMDIYTGMGVNLIPAYFKNDTNISRYDRIVGEAPCSAIQPIVEKCANSPDKEYFITMCDCCSPRNGVTGFVEYLREKDKNLRAFTVTKEYDVDKKKFTGKKKFYINKNGELDEFDTTYITNSTKHDDDIMDAIYKVEMCV